MICPKCGTTLQPNVNFCRQCGTKVDSTINSHAAQYQYNFNYSNNQTPTVNIDNPDSHRDQFTYSYNYSNKEKPDYNLNSTHQDQYDYNYLYSKFNYVPTQSVGDEKYIEAFVGPNYQIIKNVKFSIGSLFFGGFYILYRKMYLLALLYFFLTIASTFLLGEAASFINMIINLILAFKFNDLYLAHAERKVEQIKQSNFDKTSTELLVECRKKGGVSLAKTIAIIIIISIAIPLISLIGFALIIKDNVSTNPSPEEYSYQIKDLSYNRQPNLLPLTTTDEYASFYYNNGTANCNLDIKTIYTTETTDEYLTNTYNITAPKSISTYQTQNILWKNISTNNSANEISVYATKKDDTIYTIKLFNTPEDHPTCTRVLNNVLNSSKFTN